ncbi:MAG: hypothetical protein ACK4GJ_04155 [bacterium]
MDSFVVLNNVLRIFVLIVVGITHFWIFGNISSDYTFYGWILLSLILFWNLIFIFLAKSEGNVLLSGVVDGILGLLFIFFSKNPVGVFFSLMIPSVTAIQFSNNYYRYIVFALSLIFTVVGLSGIFSLVSDPFFPNILSFLVISSSISFLMIITFFMLKKVVYNFEQQMDSYREQNELLIGNINELENKIHDYENQIDNLKNELEQERVAFNVEIEKIVKEFQSRKDETYTQLKAINNELVMKDKTIQELNQNINNLINEIEEYKNQMKIIRDMISFLNDNIDDFQSLYKISKDIIDMISSFIDYDTFVIFLKNELEDKVDTFIVAGENSEFYYNYKKIEVEEVYKNTFYEGKISIAYKAEDSVLRPFYPKEQVALAVPLDAAKKRIGIMYLAYLDESKYKDFDEDFLLDIAKVVSIMLYFSISYSKSINRVIWDDRLFCYSAEFIWEFINNLVFSYKRYREHFALLFISFRNLFGKTTEDFKEEDFKFLRDINMAIKSAIRETDMISYIDNGIILVLLTKVESDKLEMVCRRIKNVTESKSRFLGYDEPSYAVCSLYSYKGLEIQELIDFSIRKLSENIQNKKIFLEVLA